MANEVADVIVVGAGNAAFCAALAAREQGASVLVLEAAPEDEFGGNSRFTAGSIRVVYNGVDDIKTLIPDLTPKEIEETDFGTYKLPKNGITVLATQGYYGRRKDMFRQELLYALKMVEEGHVKLADLRSSWGGAMGLTQFLPSEFYKYAVDFDGDGKKDIWKSVPDALASAAQQLAGKGWQRGVHWAYEVRVPSSVDCTIGVPEVTRPLGEWLKQGYVLAHGRKPDPAELSEPASLLLPEGTYGPAFLTLKNYYVIKEYNFSDLYVLFVGHLSDRIRDPRAFETPWSKNTQLRTAQVETMQRTLTKLGLYKDKIDGKAGMLTRSALGAYQKANRLKVDCWPTSAVLDDMQKRAAGN